MKIQLSATLTFLFLLISMNACAIDYENIQTGRLTGKLIVQWLEPDVFLFIPDSNKPLTFTRSNGATLSPGRMITDGGSIPRPMRAFRNYSPWGYAPGFVVHDWLFRMKHCHLSDYELYNLEEAGLVLAEVMKTMMETNTVEKDATTIKLMYTAVTSRFARKYWDADDCRSVPTQIRQNILQIHLSRMYCIL